MNNDIDSSIDLLYDSTSAFNSFITALAECLTPDIAAAMVPTLDLSIDEFDRSPEETSLGVQMLLCGWRNHLAAKALLPERRLEALRKTPPNGSLHKKFLH
ncbi:hypothetical protein [Pseudoalteromonas obscura]|uniref:Uncharacterized protein n=1 Tax=Pseudoalteromonas obscura TaxID=3048491 RepID=A0ABT7EUB0_9GAMM|nr:hypothetical protein [Pseudoalteromonas sp. P94(2023)]MDK2598639.1 hypothetical protein [Pseudoalteromonas sp. P94(2023)]